MCVSMIGNDAAGLASCPAKVAFAANGSAANELTNSLRFNSTFMRVSFDHVNVPACHQHSGAFIKGRLSEAGQSRRADRSPGMKTLVNLQLTGYVREG